MLIVECNAGQKKREDGVQQVPEYIHWSEVSRKFITGKSEEPHSPFVTLECDYQEFAWMSHQGSEIGCSPSDGKRGF